MELYLGSQHDDVISRRGGGGEVEEGTPHVLVSQSIALAGGIQVGDGEVGWTGGGEVQSAKD